MSNIARDGNALSAAYQTHPDWPAPNYVNPQTRAPMLQGVSCALGALMVIMVSLRLYSHRVISKRGLGADDWMMVVAATFGVGLVIVGCICAAYGTGYHQWDLRPEWYTHWGKATFCQNFFLTLAATCTKVSIIFTYRNLFPSRANRIFCQTAIVFLCLYCLVSIIVTFLQCIPLRSYWDQTIVNKKCIEINDYLYTMGAINSFTDVVVFLWPSRTLFSLQLPMGKRLGLIATFAAGLIAVVASILRMVAISNATIDPDSTYAGTFVTLWKVVEVTFGVDCGCLPALKPIVAPWLPEGFRSSIPSHGRSHGPSKYGNSTFKQLGAESTVGRGMDIGSVKAGNIAVTTETEMVVMKRVGDSESEEWIIEGVETPTGSRHD